MNYLTKISYPKFDLATEVVDIKTDDSGVTVISFADRITKNVLTEKLLLELKDIFKFINSRDTNKAIIITGYDSYFLTDDDYEDSANLVSLVQLEIASCKVPVIGAMCGNASGFGWLLGLCCDVVICSEEHDYYLNTTPSSRCLGAAPSLILPAKLGNYLAGEVLLAGRIYKGKEFKNSSEIISVPCGEVESYAKEIAKKWSLFSNEKLDQLKYKLSKYIRDNLENTFIKERKIKDKISQSLEAPVNNFPILPPEIIELSSNIITLKVFENGTALITMRDRIDKNTFNDLLANTLKEAFSHINNNNRYKVVVLTGYDNYFASGGSKKSLLAIQSGSMKFTDVKIFDIALQCKVPVIAAMQGHAIGAGWAMGMFCDFAIFSSESVYVSNYMQFGFTPGAGATLIFSEKFTSKIAQEILLTAREFKGNELKERGICMPVVSRAETVNYAMELANKVATCSRNTLIQLKSLLSHDLRSRIEDTYRQEVEMHEKTFVGNQDVLNNIEASFNDVTNSSDIADYSTNSSTSALDVIRIYLCESLAKELFMDINSVDDDKPFIDMGLDSVTGVTWIKTISAEYGCVIEATKVYDYPTINQLAQYVSSIVPGQASYSSDGSSEPVKDNHLKYKSPQPTIITNDTETIISYLRKSFAHELFMEEEVVDTDLPFIDMGLDSVTGVSWINKVNAKLGLAIEATKIYDYPTIDIFARYISKKIKTLGIQIPPLQVVKEQIFDKKTKIAVTKSYTNFSKSEIRPGIENKSNKDSSEILSTDADLNIQNKCVKKKNYQSNGDKSEAIAIIGMSGQFPMSTSLQKFWDNLASGKDCISDIPIERWSMDEYYDSDPEAVGKTYSKQMGVLQDVDKFDPMFFNITPAEAVSIEPQQRLFLENCWSSIENAGMNPKELSGTKSGVFVGCSISDYGQGLSAQDLMGGAASILSARISYFLNLKGPSLAIDTACSASLVAIAEACNSLILGNCELALAGGVCVLSGPSVHIMTSKAGMLSSDNRCFTFDSRANGFVPSEGVGVLVLKRYSEAVRDNDPITGIIRGWGVNQDGKTNGITAPSVNSQIELEKEVYSRFNINPDTISLVEAHGTGTKLGDPIEVEALTKSFKCYTSKKQYCALGSVKSNIGHSMTAAGVAGVIKVLLAFQHKLLPPTINFESLNEHISLSDSPFYINTELQPWKSISNLPRRAAVSSFGFSGTNAHIVLEEYPFSDTVNNRSQCADNNKFTIFALSAKSEKSLIEYAQRILEYIKETDIDIADIAYTLQIGRESMNYRLAVVTDSIQDLVENLNSYINNSKTVKFLTGVIKKNRKSAISPLDDDVDVKYLINAWIEKRNFKKLAQLWIDGFSIDWNLLYGENKPNKINLPTHPFADERYWRNKPDLVIKSIPIENNSIGTTSQDALTIVLNDVAEITNIPLEKIDVDADFEELGLDSILITTLNKKLESRFGNIDTTLFFKYKTLTDLAAYLEKNYLKVIIKGQTNVVNKSITTNIPDPQSQQVINYTDASDRAEPDIAIIGMNGMYPAASNIDEFWENLCIGKDCITEIPTDRFDYESLLNNSRGEKESFYCKWGGFIDGVDMFDAMFFNVSPTDARNMDPHERLFLESVWNCMESAGYINPNWQKLNRNVGVFVGTTFNNYQLLAADAVGDKLLSPINSQIFSIANHVSYYFNFSGPSIAIDTACSASLNAIHLACESIIRGESDMAVAGGVNLTLHLSKYYTICSRGFAASDGRCHAFTEGGDGYVPSEGVGAVLLKPYKQALADNDNILAVIKGTGVSHDGKTQNYTVPNPIAQTKAIEASLIKSNINPETISFVEAHGTGTALGDPIEITGLMDAYSKYTKKKQYCAIGSVKSNIGHGEAAAGIAQLTKTVLQLQNKIIVPSLLHGNINPNIDFKNSAFYVQEKIGEWVQPTINDKLIPRRAGISSFGAGGVNVHIIVEEFQNDYFLTDNDVSTSNAFFVFPFSAHVQSLIPQIIENLILWFEKKDNNYRLEDIAYTLQTKRASLRYRIAFIAKNKLELIEKLNNYMANKNDISAQKNYFEADSKRKIAGEVNDILVDTDSPSINDSNKKEQEVELAKRWVNGEAINWLKYFGDNNRNCCLPLPNYPFDKKRYWITDEYNKNFNTTKKQYNNEPAIVVDDSIDSANFSMDNLIAKDVQDNLVIEVTHSKFLENLIDLSDYERKDELEKLLELEIKSVMGFEQSDNIDSEQGFFELGMESMQALKLKQVLEEKLVMSLSDTILFDYPTINGLSDEILNNISWDALLEAEETFSKAKTDNLTTDAEINIDALINISSNDVEPFFDTEIADMAEEAVIEELMKELNL